MNESDPPKKSKFTESWKSLAGNLFGVQFDGSSDLEDIDIDSVAETVEQMNPASSPNSAGPANDIAEKDLSFDGDETESTLEAAGDDAMTQADEAPRKRVSASRNSEADDSGEESTVKSYDRATFEDEDPFGFGIADENLLDFDDDDENDEELSVAENETTTPVSQPVSETATEEDPDLEALLDFESDFEEQVIEADITKAVVTRKSENEPTRTRKSPGEKPPAETENAKDETTASASKKETDSEDDGFWDSLEDWDSGAANSLPPKEEKKPMRSRTPRRKANAAPPAKDKQDVASKSTESLDSGEDDQQPRPKRSRRRRRRPTRSQKDKAATTEVAAEEIDLLWDGNDDTETVLPSGKNRESDSLRSETESEREKPGGRRRRGPRKQERETKDSSDSAKETGQRSNEDQKPSGSYGNIPTWIEAIEMIARAKDPTPGKQRSAGRRGNGARPSGRKRTPRRRET